MKKLFPLGSRFFALWFTIGLALPNPAFALREIQIKNSGVEERELTDALMAQPAAGAEQAGGMSVEVIERMALMNRFLKQVETDPLVLFGAGLHDLSESFGKSIEIRAFGREWVRPLLAVPERASLPSASLASKIIEITTNPAEARFVIGGRDFVQSYRENRKAVFLQVDPLTVGAGVEQAGAIALFESA